jgi:UBX domain-containing protein 1/4
MGANMALTREQHEAEQRKRDAYLRQKEKQAYAKERARIKAELEKDKLERMANKGKLKSKLGVEGYHPDAIQYDVSPDGGAATGADAPHPEHKKPKVDPGKITEYIDKVSSYRAGGDGGKCLKVLLAYVGNVVDHPDEEKYRSINMDNKVFKTRVKPLIGGKQLLMAVGFQQSKENHDMLVLGEHCDAQLLADTKAKLQAAIERYG